MNTKEKNELTEKLKKVLPVSPVFKISYTDDAFNCHNSKIGGSFYWPIGVRPPEDMHFLAQINFAELPENDIFPKQGMLQFFVGDVSAYGLFSENGYLVVHHREVSDDDGIEICMDATGSPITHPAKMTFTLTEEYLSFSDFRFTRYFDLDNQPDEAQDCVYKEFCSEGSRLLGYPYFTQTDPREFDHSKYDTLLLQLDSEGEHIMWGDCGVANFFIKKEDLEKQDFSDIFYTWDCC